MYVWGKGVRGCWADEKWAAGNTCCLCLHACLPATHLPLHLVASPKNALGTYLVTTVCNLDRTVNQSILHPPDRSRTSHIICEASCATIIKNFHMATAGVKATPGLFSGQGCVRQPRLHARETHQSNPIRLFLPKNVNLDHNDVDLGKTWNQFSL